MTLDHEAANPDVEEGEDGRPDAPRTWTAPELVRLRAGATGNQTTGGVAADGPSYFFAS